MKFEFKKINKKWNNQKKLKIACNIPTPVVAPFISNRISWEFINCDGEHTPPIVLAIAEVHLICVPPRACC